MYINFVDFSSAYCGTNQKGEQIRTREKREEKKKKKKKKITGMEFEYGYMS